MSLYNMIFGSNSGADALFAMLKLTPDDFYRYRDIYVTETHIVVHTRGGGGNREASDADYSYHPLFDYDEDDDFDCTYANYYFKHPEPLHELLVELSQRTLTPSERWARLFESLKP